MLCKKVNVTLKIMKNDLKSLKNPLKINEVQINIKLNCIFKHNNNVVIYYYFFKLCFLRENKIFYCL